MSWDDSDIDYDVVVSHEEQYSIWPEYQGLPKGWQRVGESGKKTEFPNYNEEVWTDMRPLSLRRQLEEMKLAKK